MRLKLRSRARVHLSPGVYLLPAHFTPDEVEGTAELLRDLLPDVEEVHHVSWGEVAGCSSSLPAAGRGLLVVRDIPDVAADVEEPLARAATSARYVLARVGPAYERGFGWLERMVKPAVVSALRSAAREASQPYAPVLQAAALTGDPLELVALVEGAIEHRVHHAGEGLTPADYERSLHVVAGERLGARLSRLHGEDMSAAFEVLLTGGEGDRNDTRFRRGAAGLSRVGLAVYFHGDIALGPLARAGSAPGAIHDALIERVPPEALSSFSVEKLGHSDDTPAPPIVRGLTAKPIDALILTVLPEVHAATLEAAGITGDDGEVTITEVGDRPLRLAIAHLRQHAGFVSDRQAMELVASMRPPVVAMCGLCVGLPGKVQLGDVIVADAIVRYDSYLGPKLLYRLDPALYSRVHDGLVHLGALATGKQVLSNPHAPWQKLSSAARTVLGYEMETEALPVIAKAHGIAAMGVAGLAGEKEDAAARRAAARAAASWLIAFLREHIGSTGSSA